MFFAWALFGALIGVAAAQRRGFSMVGGVLGGLLLGPLAFLMFFASGGQRKCPFCAEFVKTDATVCRHCDASLTVSKHPVISDHQVEFDQFTALVKETKEQRAHNQADVVAAILALRAATKTDADAGALQSAIEVFTLKVDGVLVQREFDTEVQKAKDMLDFIQRLQQLKLEGPRAVAHDPEGHAIYFQCPATFKNKDGQLALRADGAAFTGDVMVQIAWSTVVHVARTTSTYKGEASDAVALQEGKRRTPTLFAFSRN